MIDRILLDLIDCSVVVSGSGSQVSVLEFDVGGYFICFSSHRIPMSSRMILG